MLPEAQRVLCNEKTCSVLNINNNGLGLGRQYSKEPNGLLDPFKQCPQALDDNKCRLTEDNFNYYQLKSGDTVSEESEEVPQVHCLYEIGYRDRANYSRR